jgi:hypothetical protein
VDKYLFDESNGLWYKLRGDRYAPCPIRAEEEIQPIGLREQRRKQHLKEHKRHVYTTMQLDGTQNRYLAAINQQAEQTFHRLIKEMAERQGMTETRKAEQSWEWIGSMNNIQPCAKEGVNSELIDA